MEELGVGELVASAPRKLCDGTGSSLASWRWGIQANDKTYNEIPDFATSGKWQVWSGGQQNNIDIETRGILGSSTPVTMSLGPLTLPSRNFVDADCTAFDVASLDAIMDFTGSLQAPGLDLYVTAHGMLCTVVC